MMLKISSAEKFCPPIFCPIRYCQYKSYNSGKAKFRNDPIGKSFVDDCNIDGVVWKWIVDAGYALMPVIPRDTYRRSFNNLFRWILPDRTLKPAEILIKVDEYRKDITKKGENKIDGMVETMGRVFLSLIWSKKMPKEKIEWNTFLSFGENKSDFMSLFGKYLQTDNGIDLVDGLKITFFGIRTLWINRKGSGRYVQKYLTKYHTLLPCQP